MTTYTTGSDRSWAPALRSVSPPQQPSVKPTMTSHQHSGPLETLYWTFAADQLLSGVYAFGLYISRITDLLEALPQLSDGEHVRVSASADSTSLDCADGLCNEETFFTINAMNHMSVCRCFPKCRGAAQDLIPITKVSHNNRTVKFFCQVCHTVFDAICERDLDPCPSRQIC